MDRKRYVALAVVFLIGVGVVRILLTYDITAQAFDEPCHVAAAIELLDKGTYTLDPVHPPLTRIAIGIPLYLAGARFPDWAGSDPRVRNYNDVGNFVLDRGGLYLRNLALARSATLPFFGLTVILVFLWTRHEFGDFAAVMAAVLFTTLPIVLAFSGLAYTDLPTGGMQFAALFAFTTWLQKPGLRSSLLLGLVSGLAFLAKLTTILFLPAAAATIVLTRWLIERRIEHRTEHDADAAQARGQIKWPSQLSMALAVAALVIWAGYGFSVGHIQQAMQISPEAMPSFQHFPGPARSLARTVVEKDFLLPAPPLVSGVATAWVLNNTAPAAYLLGQVKQGGWWYFFLVGVGVKTPLPFLLLDLVGLWAILSRPMPWTALAPAASTVAIFVVTMFLKYNAGVRHVMLVFPLLAVIAGCGCEFLWVSPGRSRVWARSALAALLLWQCVSSLKSAPDYIAYFNELAGRDPSRVLVTGCDLDCGQDLFRLSEALHERHISQLNLAVWSSADMTHMNLPAFETLPPFQPVTGWVAISLRSLRFGDLFHSTYPPDAFAWLNRRQPAAKIGKTILLYYFPPDAAAGNHGPVIGAETCPITSGLHRESLCLLIVSHCVYNRLSPLRKMNQPEYRSRRWTVIAAGLLCGALALIVLFTNRGAFFSPLAVVVMGAVGLAAVLLQLRLQDRDQAKSSRSPAWLNVLGILFALAAFFADLLHFRPQLVEALALGAVASFGVSGVIILRGFRKGLAAK